eukprot:GFUD01035393.1.p1 GENE.GFUD01035393.1~~GFUD01035393.1.p1  ORF type:complete len:178 (+),score=29.32 GFUD01035393.1:198-731(+)
MSLQNLCKQAVLKFGIATDKLPESIIEELKTLEERLYIDFTGLYGYGHENLSIDWTGGMWSFTHSTTLEGPLLKHYEAMRGGHLTTMEIKVGEESHLGLAGGKLFLVPGANVFVECYDFDFEELKVVFHGRFPSVIGEKWYKFKSTFSSSRCGFKLRTEFKISNKVLSRERYWSRLG